MSQSYDLEVELEDPRSDKPAIGALATGKNDDEIARICLRALANHHDIIIVESADAELSIPEVADVPTVTVVEMDGSERGQLSVQDRARQQLDIAAQSRSQAGVLFVPDTSTPIDFQASVERFDSETFVCDAVPESTADVDTLVAIPAYNEADTIGTVVRKASAHADDVVVVDDGSDDETEVQANAAGATVVSHERNRGYGAALKTAFQTADTWDVECLVVLDGDDQHDVADVPKLAERVTQSDANVAIGSRFAGEAASDIPLYRRFGLGVVNVMSNLSLGAVDPRSWVTDTQSGFRAYDRHAIEDLANAGLGDDMDASLDILYHVHGNGFEIDEVSTVVDYDVDDGHSQNPVTHGIRLVSTILRTVERDHPIKFLGIPGTVFTLVGLLFGYMTIANFMTTQSFPLGMALSSATFTLLGVLSAFTAIMLHSLSTHFDA